MTGKKLIFNFTPLFLTILLLSSCTTAGYTSFDYDYPILDIQATVGNNLPEGIGATNSNRRVFYSKKFSVKHNKKRKIPLVMRIIINGDRRPYSLIVEVREVAADIAKVDEAFNFGNEFRGQDSLAKRVVTGIRDQLAQRRKSKNIFDDFKAF